MFQMRMKYFVLHGPLVVFQLCQMKVYLKENNVHSEMLLSVLYHDYYQTWLQYVVTVLLYHLQIEAV